MVISSDSICSLIDIDGLWTDRVKHSEPEAIKVIINLQCGCDYCFNLWLLLKCHFNENWKCQRTKNVH